MDKETTPTPNIQTGAKYRGAVVEDLQLPPAFCLEEHDPLHIALEAAYEREFDHLPILNHQRKPIGYLSVPVLKSRMEKNQLDPSEPVLKYTTHFPLSSKNHPYTVIHNLTPLEELEAFFSSSGTDFALVTDHERKWVLAVATKTDLETFVKRRG